ncbi:MAG: hypothetical protein Q8Q12_15895, partial [bacterium]|nr:hypothetical protein [bacterium]
MMRMLGLLLLLVFFSPLPASAATWYVDASVASSGDGTTWATAFKIIQEGIDAAPHGDKVLVAQGTYVENIKFNGNNITLTSTDPLNPSIVANTIIDGSQSGSVVTFSGTEDETCVLSGFTIRNGHGVYGGGICGGTWEKTARAAIENSLVTGNWARYGGGGMAHCGGTIRANVVSQNSTDQSSGAVVNCHGTIVKNAIVENKGEGLYACNGLIEENRISENGSNGLSSCDGIIQNNLISRNGGNGLHYCHATIENNVISKNLSAGVYQCSGLILNNTIFGNSLGLYNCAGPIRNCIIWGNRVYRQLDGSSSPMYSCIENWNRGGEGNIPSNPYFISAETDDFRLESWSSCIDAGDPASPFSNEPEPNGSR